MNRSEYLRDSSVEAFIDWLRPHVRGDCLFQHKFTMLKPHLDWSCNSIWEAYENYWWPIPRSKHWELRGQSGRAGSPRRRRSSRARRRPLHECRVDKGLCVDAGWLSDLRRARWRGNGLSRTAVLRQRPPLPGSDAAAFPVGCGKGQAQPQPVDALALVPRADRHQPPDVGGV